MKNIDEKIVILAASNYVEKISKYTVSKMGLSIKVFNVEDKSLNKVVDNLIKRAEECRKNGAEIAIVTVGADKLIKKHVDINTVTIDATGYDILRYLYKYKNYNDTIAVVEGAIYLEGIKKIGKILGLDIYPYEAYDYQDTHNLINKAIEDGQKLIISGTGALHEFERSLIKNKGVIYEQIEPSDFSVTIAIREAFNLYEATMNERRKKQMLKTMFDSSLDGLISTNEQGIITRINYYAEKIFNCKKDNVIGKYICDIIPEIDIAELLISNKKKNSKIIDVMDTKVVFYRLPLLVRNDVLGFVFKFEKVQNLQKKEKKIRYELSKKGLTAKYTFCDIIGKSEAIIKLKEIAKNYSKMQSTILISGDTGTGKEVFAQAIHNESNRKNEPFVAINCSALPGNLLESELFGYVEGAFTGARKGGKQGIFELAHEGTIFLDEIGEIDKTVQARLLRVIQERQVMRIGDDKIIPIDVRIIAATNKDLYDEVENNKFRKDLFFRLNVLNIDIPSLKERIDDLDVLIEFLINKLNKELKCKVTGFDKEIIKNFKEYDWPGNIRELENMVEKILVNIRIGFVKKNEVKFILNQLEKKLKKTSNNIYNQTLEEIEKDVIMKILKEENYNKSKVAKRLGIDRSTLFRKLNKY